MQGFEIVRICSNAVRLLKKRVGDREYYIDPDAQVVFLSPWHCQGALPREWC